MEDFAKGLKIILDINVITLAEAKKLFGSYLIRNCGLTIDGAVDSFPSRDQKIEDK